jgi:hypothetical protein
MWLSTNDKPEMSAPPRRVLDAHGPARVNFDQVVDSASKLAPERTRAVSGSAVSLRCSVWVTAAYIWP